MQIRFRRYGLGPLQSKQNFLCYLCWCCWYLTMASAAKAKITSTKPVIESRVISYSSTRVSSIWPSSTSVSKIVPRPLFAFIRWSFFGTAVSSNIHRYDLEEGEEMGRLVEPHGFTAVPPPTALRRAEPSDPSAKAYGQRAEAYPHPSPPLRAGPSSLRGEGSSQRRQSQGLAWIRTRGNPSPKTS